MQLKDRLGLATALGIIDVQVDFCAPGGWRDRNGGDLSYMEGTIDNILRIRDAARLAKPRVEVFFTQQVYDTVHQTKAHERQVARGDRQPTCDVRTGGHELYRVAPDADGERVFQKRTFNIFDCKGLPEHLTGTGAENLVLVGVDTQICVEMAARVAYDRGYSVVVVGDAVCSSGRSRHLHDAALELIAKNFGTVCTTEELLAAWA